MKLILENNQYLSSLTVTNNAKGKCELFYGSNCKGINTKQTVDSILEYQSETNDSTVQLKSVRFCLPYDSVSDTYKFSGTYDSLVSYGTLSGATIGGESVAKPIIEGTWNITDYIDDGMSETLSGENGLFNSNFPVLSSNYHINWNDIAVQTLDSTKSNYNPAVAIILNSKSLGHVYENTQHFAGKWWITKTEAAAVKDIEHWFSSVSSVTDTGGIVSTNTASSYVFDNFDSLSGFTGLCSLAVSAFGNNENLSSLRFPNSLQFIPTKIFEGSTAIEYVGTIPESVKSVNASAFAGCLNLDIDSLGNGILEIEPSAFHGCSSLSVTELPSSVRYISNSAFNSCSSLSITEIPSSVGYVGIDAFNGCTGISYLHIDGVGSKVGSISGSFDGASYPIYVGSNESPCMSERLVGDYIGDSAFSTCSSRISSWREFGYMRVLSSIPGFTDTYELQKFVVSDGINSIDTGTTYVDGTRFSTDVSFISCSSADGGIVHGSGTIGLSGIRNIAITASVSGSSYQMVPMDGITENTPHNYTIDLSNSKLTVDGNTISPSGEPTSGDGSAITLFGNSAGGFSGASWMNRVTVNGVVQKDYVPVRRKSDNKVGFYDIKSRSFITVDSYSSDSVRIVVKDGNSNIITTEGGVTLVF